MLAVILSGGLGTRLHPLTLNTPKPMLPIDGIPHLEYIIRHLKAHGYKDIIFSTGYLHEQIENHFGKTILDTLKRFGVIIRYKEDGDIPLGTAGALRNCLDLIDEEQVLVMNGDILSNIDLTMLKTIHEHCRMPITMAMLEVEDARGFGLIKYDLWNKKVQEFTEKPQVKVSGAINAGVYMIHKGVIELISEKQFSMLETDVFPNYVGARMVQGMLCSPAFSTWIDIGTHERYEQAQHLVKKLNF